MRRPHTVIDSDETTTISRRIQPPITSRRHSHGRGINSRACGCHLAIWTEASSRVRCVRVRANCLSSLARPRRSVRMPLVRRSAPPSSTFSSRSPSLPLALVCGAVSTLYVSVSITCVTSGLPFSTTPGCSSVARPPMHDIVAGARSTGQLSASHRQDLFLTPADVIPSLCAHLV